MSQLHVFLKTNEAWDFFLIKNQRRWGLYFLSHRTHLKHLCLQLAVGAEPAHNGSKPSVCTGSRAFTWLMALQVCSTVLKLVAPRLFRSEGREGGCVFWNLALLLYQMQQMAHEGAHFVCLWVLCSLKPFEVVARGCCWDWLNFLSVFFPGPTAVLLAGLSEALLLRLYRRHW